jgi:type III pantothenate kinase
VIGKNTVECMQSGIIYGNASCIDGMIDRMSEELCQSTGKTRKDIKVIATGGLASVIIPYCKNKIIQDANLLLKGLKVIYDKNVDKEAAKC